MRDPGASERWERRTHWPLMGAATLFLGAYAWPVLDPDLPVAAVRAAELTTWVVWAVFLVDYLVRLGLAPSRRAFVRSHPLELAAVVLPLLRPLALLRVVATLSVLQRQARSTLRGRIATYVVGATLLLVGVSALAVLEAEREHPDAQITTYGQALWWAVTTVTSVGYGDFVPVTWTGRLAAAGLMVAGIGVLGVVTATLASWLVEQVTVHDEAEQRARAASRAQVEELSRQVERLVRALDDRDSREGREPRDAVASGGATAQGRGAAGQRGRRGGEDDEQRPGQVGPDVGLRRDHRDRVDGVAEREQAGQLP